jgi:hypothetical protein
MQRLAFAWSSFVMGINGGALMVVEGGTLAGKDMVRKWNERQGGEQWKIMSV